MQIHLKSKFVDEEIIVKRSQYFQGGLALVASDLEGQPACTFSIWISQSTPGLPEDQFVFKNYSENEGMLEALKEAGVVKETGQIAEVGFVECPVVRLIDPERFENLHKG